MILLNIDYNSRCSGVWDPNMRIPQRPELGYHVWGIVCRLMGCRWPLSHIVEHLKCSTPDTLLHNLELSYREISTWTAKDLTRGEKAYYSNCKEAIMPISAELRPDGVTVQRLKPYNLLAMRQKKRKAWLALMKEKHTDIFQWLRNPENVGQLRGKTQWQGALDALPENALCSLLDAQENFFLNETALLWDIDINESVNTTIRHLSVPEIDDYTSIIGFFLLSLAALKQQGIINNWLGANYSQLHKLTEQIEKIQNQEDSGKKQKDWFKVREKHILIVDRGDYPRIVFTNVIRTTQRTVTPRIIKKSDGHTSIWLESTLTDTSQRLEHEKRILDQLKSARVGCFDYGKKGLAYLKNTSHFLHCRHDTEVKQLGCLASLENVGFRLI